MQYCIIIELFEAFKWTYEGFDNVRIFSNKHWSMLLFFSINENLFSTW